MILANQDMNQRMRADEIILNYIHLIEFNVNIQIIL
jgi:hypothetical protein